MHGDASSAAYGLEQGGNRWFPLRGARPPAPVEALTATTAADVVAVSPTTRHHPPKERVGSVPPCTTCHSNALDPLITPLCSSHHGLAGRVQFGAQFVPVRYVAGVAAVAETPKPRPTRTGMNDQAENL